MMIIDEQARAEFEAEALSETLADDQARAEFDAILLDAIIADSARHYNDFMAGV
jgi:hypothetical protein|tara:strand:+ start:119 stop:280 length:162 start_codon:yes stop_codon:yes gene_type:complete